MTACPNCGFDRAHATRLVKSSAKDLVESMYLDSGLIDWCNAHAPDLNAAAEVESFKDRMRTNGYKTNAGPVKDARAAFRTHMRNAVLYAAKRAGGTAPSKAQRPVPTRKDV